MGVSGRVATSLSPFAFLSRKKRPPSFSAVDDSLLL